MISSLNNKTNSLRIILLSHADTDIAVFNNALSYLPEEFSQCIAIALQQVKSAEALVNAVSEIHEGSILLFKLLGNAADVPGLTELLSANSMQKMHKIVVSGTGETFLDHEVLSSVPIKILAEVSNYLLQGGRANFEQMLLFLSDNLLGTPYGYLRPLSLPEVGIYHPHLEPDSTLDDWRCNHDTNRSTVAIIFYRAHLLSGNTSFVDEIVWSLAEQGLDALPIFTTSLRSNHADKNSINTDSVFGILNQAKVRAVIITTSFAGSESNPNLDESSAESSLQSISRLKIPIIQAICASSTQQQWRSSTRGLSALDTAMNVAMPEFDGRIVTVPISFKQSVSSKESLSLYQPMSERTKRLALTTAKLVALQKKNNSEKRIAFVFTNASSKASQVGNAVGLDAPESLLLLLKSMQSKGYRVGNLPDNSDELMHELIERCNYDETLLSGLQCERAIAQISGALYKSWFNLLPKVLAERIAEQWGAPPGTAYINDGKLIIAGIQLGNVAVLLQPPRGYGMDPNAIYHQPDLPPTHHYLAFYRWISEIWQADAIVHVGKHGTLEWLPGKGVGLSEECFPDALLASMPLIYPFIINDPGEGSQAKRRAHSVIVDHLPPPMTSADTYGVLAQLTQLLDEYYQAETLDTTKMPVIQQQIWDLIKGANLDKDLAFILNREHEQATTHDDDGQQDHGHADDHAHDHDHDHDHDQDHDHDHDHVHEWNDTLTEHGVPVTLESMDSVEVSHLIQEIDGYLCELGAAQIRDGLHVLGNVPKDETLVETLCSLTRLPNLDVPGLHESIASSLGFDLEELLNHKGEKLQRHDSNVLRLEELCTKLVFTNSDVLEAIDKIGQELFRKLQTDSFFTNKVDKAIDQVFGFAASEQTFHQEAVDKLRQTLNFACIELLPRLQQTTDEIDNLLDAMAGRFVPPGPSGAPSRGAAHILPTGRNFYSLDPRSVPSQSAWRVGSQLAEEVVRKFKHETGMYPETVSISVWGTSAMRTHGDDIAEILAFMGVRPLWQNNATRVSGFEIISMSELGRPRIDVTTRISGLFRDAFPHLITLLDNAVNAVIDLVDEPSDVNYLRKHYLDDLAERLENGTEQKTAEQRCRYRIFGSKPGCYGAGILPLLQEKNWQGDADLAEAFLNWGSFAYTSVESGVEAKSDYSKRLSLVEVALHNQDNREHDIFDSDDYLQFHGGMIATIRSLTGKNPKRYFGDSHDPARAKVRDLGEETLRVFRSRVVNPKWIESIKRHGYKGALELTATVDYLFGYDATAGVLEDWMYEEVAKSYALDPIMQEFLRESNPWALQTISERLLEAAQRKLWKEPMPDTLKSLERVFLESELNLEARAEEKTKLEVKQ